LAKARQGETAAKPAESQACRRYRKARPKSLVEKPAVAGDEVDWMWPASGKLMATLFRWRQQGHGYRRQGR
jgi:hypothetical protein